MLHVNTETRQGELSNETKRLTWTKSQHSNPNGACVELTRLPSGDIVMRNSRHAESSVLIYTQEEIRAFFAGVKDGEFDYLIGD